MFSVTVLCVGRLKEDYLRAACEEYRMRLSAFCKISIVELPEERCPENPSPAQIHAVVEAEGERLLKKIPERAYVIPLCIEGRQMTSVRFAKHLDELPLQGYSQAVFIIGGSYGLSEEVKSRGQFPLSMSAFTFPHQLARVVLLEQLYRAFQISANGKYHK